MDMWEEDIPEEQRAVRRPRDILSDFDINAYIGDEIRRGSVCLRFHQCWAQNGNHFYAIDIRRVNKKNESQFFYMKDIDDLYMAARAASHAIRKLSGHGIYHFHRELDVSRNEDTDVYALGDIMLCMKHNGFSVRMATGKTFSQCHLHALSRLLRSLRHDTYAKRLQ